MKKWSLLSLNGLLISLLIGCAEAESVREEQPGDLDLPYYDEASFTPHWPAEEGTPVEDYHRVSPFSLHNQFGEIVSDKSVAGRIRVVSFFFTTCGGICPALNANVKQVQEAFAEEDEVLLLSHSVTPESDSVPVLRHYGEELGVRKGKWHLLTGDREAIYSLGRTSYFIEEDLGLQRGVDEFLHSENIVLVDREGHIRGIYNGLSQNGIDALISDIRKLL